MSSFAPAGQAEIIRSSQKDEQNVLQLKAEIHDLVQKLAGLQRWLKWREDLDTLADVIYYAVTTIAGFQTLGEEYVHIVQVDPTLRQVPSRRMVYVLLHSASPFLLRLSTRQLKHKLQSGTPLWPEFLNQEEVRKRLIIWVPRLTMLLNLLQKCHLVAFYFFGGFYHIAKRVTGIRYVLIRNWLASQQAQRGYHILGWMTLVQLCLSLMLQIISHPLSGSLYNDDLTTSTDSKNGNQKQLVRATDLCALCLEKRQHTTLTPCGHLFCWKCITRWLQAKHECPMCREKLQPSRIVYLQNYR